MVWPMNGTRLENRRRDAQSPVRILVEPEHLAGERHSQRHEQEHDAGDPGQLARILVRTEEEDLHHVNEHDGDHEVRSQPCSARMKPARRDMLIQRMQAVPGLSGRRDID